MAFSNVSTRSSDSIGITIGIFLLAATGFSWGSMAYASSYIGDSFFRIPGQTGHWIGQDYKGWVRAEANDWPGIMRPLTSGYTDPLAGDKMYFAGPGAPRPGGPGKLVVALAKNNPDLPQLMSMCAKHTVIPELNYAESVERSRPIMEMGAPPKGSPVYWEYTLMDVEIASCPVAAGAEQQALVMTFKDIAWLNYDKAGPVGTPIVVKPQDLPDVKPAVPSENAKVKAFVITWIAPNSTATDEQCPVMNKGPTVADVVRYRTPEQVAALRAKVGDKGDEGMVQGLDAQLRGPGLLNAVRMPGIVPDSGYHEPLPGPVDGLDLDANDGKGVAPAGVCKHANYTAPDGRTGIDNQWYSITACVKNLRGKNGYLNMTGNARRADGNTVTLIEISGIKDEQNDNDVTVSFIASQDKPVRDPKGHTFIPNYTFRPTLDPNFALYNVHLKGHIVNGVITTEPVSEFDLNLGQNPLLKMFKARMRFEITADGDLKGLLGGYIDWRAAATQGGPPMYYQLKRKADGLKDPVTGQCNGISVAYDIDAVPAFLTNLPIQSARSN